MKGKLSGKFFGLFITAFILVAASVVFVAGYAEKVYSHAVLEGEISVLPQKGAQADKIIPGSAVLLKAVVKNVGSLPSRAGEIFIRFAYPKPMNEKPRSILFQTEKLELPSIEPGASVEISFNSPHHWPSLYEFIRNDWGLRRYQAVVSIQEKEDVIGALSILFSATYYTGPHEDLPTEVLNKE